MYEALGSHIRFRLEYYDQNVFQLVSIAKNHIFTTYTRHVNPHDIKIGLLVRKMTLFMFRRDRFECTEKYLSL